MKTTIKQLAEILAVSQRRIRQLIGEAILPPIEKGELPLAESVQRFLSYKLAQRESKTLLAARLRKLDADGKRSELELRKTCGELVERDKVGDFFGEVCIAIRQRILASQLASADQDEILIDLQRLKKSPFAAAFEKPVAI